jgi:hypothetical protein
MAVQPYRPLELMYDEKITNSEFSDFIGIWENFVPKSFCQNLTTYFDEYFEKTGCIMEPKKSHDHVDLIHDPEIHRSQDFYGGSLNRKDYAFLLNYANSDMTYRVNQFLKSCALHYIDTYPQLRSSGLVSTDIKFQKTPPGGGYHLWHYENGNMAHSMRELTWMIYLNDMPDGDGQTEFLYQKRRLTPTAGTVVMWPAGYTHVHKGNTVFSQDKYILTGWYIKNS